MANTLYHGGTQYPGVSQNERFVDENNVLQGRWEKSQWFQGTIASTAIDPGSSITTNLRHGLLLGKNSNGEYVQYDPEADDATVGSLKCEAVLLKSTSTLNAELSAQDKASGSLLVSGIIDPSKLVIGENSSRGIVGDDFEYDVRKQLAGTGNFIFEDEPQEPAIGQWKYQDAKTSDYTLLEADRDVQWTNEGAAGAVNFTLPATAKKGLAYYFYVKADQTVTVTAGTADTMITFNDVAADSVAFSTSSEKVGAALQVVGNGAKWEVTNLAPGHTMTVVS